MLIKSITTGFLDGNLFDGCEENVDHAESAQMYAEMLRQSLQVEYPGAEVMVFHQEASGCKPLNYNTTVYTDEDDVSEKEAANVDRIAEDVWKKMEWIVEDTSHEIVQICITCDTTECGYRIVELACGDYAFVWGNIACGIGDSLPEKEIDLATDEHGIWLFDTYEEAEQAWRDCAKSLSVYGNSGERACAEMLSHLGENND